MLNHTFQRVLMLSTKSKVSLVPLFARSCIRQVEKGHFPVVLCRNIYQNTRLKSNRSLEPKSHTSWKPLSDPEAKKELMKRLIPVAGASFVVVLGISLFVLSFYTHWW